MNSASSAWAQERVQWEIGSQTGRITGGTGRGHTLAGVLSIGTLGVGGAGVSLKSRRHGVACMASGTGQRTRRRELGGVGNILVGVGMSVGGGVDGGAIALLGAL